MAEYLRMNIERSSPAFRLGEQKVVFVEYPAKGAHVLNLPCSPKSAGHRAKNGLPDRKPLFSTFETQVALEW